MTHKQLLLRLQMLGFELSRVELGRSYTRVSAPQGLTHGNLQPRFMAVIYPPDAGVAAALFERGVGYFERGVGYMAAETYQEAFDAVIDAINHTPGDTHE